MSIDRDPTLPPRPLVFACAGCSHAGRLAYDVAQEMDGRGVAEMSCLAGIGAQKANFLKQLRGRTVWVIDGCPIECAAGVFDDVHQKVDVHIRLHDYGVRKDQSMTQSPTIQELVQSDVLQEACSVSQLRPECDL